MTTTARILALAGALAARSPDLRAQSGAPLTAHGAPAVYTADQASRGEAVFTRSCASCHAASFFSASAFRRSWAGRPAFDLFEQLRTTMPNDNPGRLRRQEYADLVAYILQLNGVAPGTAELPLAPDSLRLVRITFAAGQP